ncbi:transferrin-binding protein-like solute binding protein [Pelagibacterium xiamenense]|uniref:transferrin-binding protein-like solute binding protein n=1 Tax=Pelagibacterium xiamenense TaxID=2901140 RepID=UPI001E4721E9|nr:transferrin-binding protein-like solute binding protein [Pelagibacterium xiamenense]MCD7059782.1 transferrin-binding protein-like solute binding protein [Pelagibacterium xiamenense]
MAAITRRLMPLGALPLAAGLAACTGTGSPNLTTALAEGITVPALSSDGTDADRTLASLRIAEDGATMTVAAGDANYTMALERAGAPFSVAGWEDAGDFTVFGFAGPSGGAEVIIGTYVVTAVASAAGNTLIAQGGFNTPAAGLPETRAQYEGFWTISGVSGALGTAEGVFDATADFDAGTIVFAISDADGAAALGSGSGTLDGNTFSSSYNLTSGPNTSNNTVEGNFYGPSAEEMAGLIAGTGGGEASAGLLFGQKK